MATPLEILAAIAPETDAVENAVRDLHLELAEAQTGKVYGAARNHAVALLAAHTLTLAGRSGTSGSITSAKEGALSLSYAKSGDSGLLGSTSYGAELMRLRRQYIFSARTVKVCP